MKPYESNFVRLLLRQAATNPAEATVVTDSQTSGWNSGGVLHERAAGLGHHSTCGGTLKQPKPAEAHPHGERAEAARSDVLTSSDDSHQHTAHRDFKQLDN